MLKRISRHIILLAFLLPCTLWAQESRLKNQPKYDRRKIHFGFCLGLNFYDLKITPKADLSLVPGVYDFWTDPTAGYSIGIVSNLRLTENLDLRFIPTFSSTLRKLYVDLDNPITLEREIKEYEIESSFIQFPFELKFKSNRINNHRWYVIGGIQYNLDLASKEKVEDETIFKLARSHVAYEVGVGIDIYFEYFKFSPQLKGAFGINSVMVEDGTLPVSAMDKVLSRCILINFTFE